MNFIANDCEVAYYHVMTLDPDERFGKTIHLGAKLGSALFSVRFKFPGRTETAVPTEGEGSQSQRLDEIRREYEPFPVPPKNAFQRFLEFLKLSPKPVLLVAHTYETCTTLLLKFIVKLSMVDMFDDVIAGFSSTVSIFKNKWPRRLPSELTIPLLAKDFLLQPLTKNRLDSPSISSDLEQLVTQANVSKSDLILNGNSYKNCVSIAMQAGRFRNAVESFMPMKSAVGLEFLVRMARAELQYSSLEEVFHQAGSQGLQEFLYERQDRTRLHCHNWREKVQKIVRFFETQNLVNQVPVPNDHPFDRQQGGLSNEIGLFMEEQNRVNQVPFNNSYPSDRQQGGLSNEIGLFLEEQNRVNQVPFNNSYPSDRQQGGHSSGTGPFMEKWNTITQVQVSESNRSERHQGQYLNDNHELIGKQNPSSQVSVGKRYQFDSEGEEDLNAINELILEQDASNQVPVSKRYRLDDEQKEISNKIVSFLKEGEPCNQVSVNEDKSSNGQQGKLHFDMKEHQNPLSANQVPVDQHQHDREYVEKWNDKFDPFF